MVVGVLDLQVATHQNLRVYAHCMKDTKGGVSMLTLNTDQRQAAQIPCAAKAATAFLPEVASGPASDPSISPRITIRKAP